MSRSFISTRLLASGAIALMLAVAPGASAQHKRGELDVRFDTRSPGTATGMSLDITYRPEGDPNGKPSPIRKLHIDAPAGTRFDRSALPQCEATDDMLRALASKACPAESRIGGGTITAITGFGPPADPFVGKATLFNWSGGFIETVEEQGGGPIAYERLRVTGSAIDADIAKPPGGPPDGASGVSKVELRFDPGTGWVTTPADCPAAGWSFSGSFTFEDGTTHGDEGTEACDTRRARSTRIALRAAPRRVRAGATVRFRFRALLVEAGRRRPLEGATVRFAGERARTGRRGRAAIVARLDEPGRYLARVSSEGLHSARTAIRVRRGPRDG